MMTSRALRPKPTDLDVMGIEELNEYIAELEAEIERVRSAIVKKSSNGSPPRPSLGLTGLSLNLGVNHFLAPSDLYLG